MFRREKESFVGSKRALNDKHAQGYLMYLFCCFAQTLDRLTNIVLTVSLITSSKHLSMILQRLRFFCILQYFNIFSSRLTK